VPDSEWIQVVNGNVHLAAQKYPGPGDCVLLLHGLAGHSGEWARVVKSTPAVDAVALDLRGHGRSERHPSDVSPEAFCSDVIEVIGTTGHKQVHLVGQSFGGHIAFLVASWHPERVASLTVIEADPEEPNPQVEGSVARWLAAWGRPFADQSTALAFFEAYGSAETWVEGLERREDGLWPQFDGDVLLSALHGIAARQWWGDWNRISCPTLVVRGDRGDLTVVVANKMAAAIPEGEVVTIAGAGHNVHLDQVERVAQVVRRRLS
jgi:pimeloyl-ACP methyl ester carboxylesterase